MTVPLSPRMSSSPRGPAQVRRSGRGVFSLALLLPALFLAACLSPDEPLPVLVWEGDLTPDPESGLSVTGQVAMVSQEFDTVMGIGITLLEEPRTLNWRIREGHCGSPGDPIVDPSAFPALVPNDQGEAIAQLTAAGRATSTTEYMAEVLLIDDGLETRVACASLVLQ
jgi:hypothetical protein